MKKLKVFITTVLFTLLFSLTALAATAKISFSDPKVTSGDDVSVNLKVKSDDGTLSRADISLRYDSNLIEFKEGSDSEGGAGTIRVHGASDGSGTGELKYVLKFKTLSTGDASINIVSDEVYDTDEQAVEITHKGSSKITIEPKHVASSEAGLQNLLISPGTLEPAFSADTMNYTASVGLDVETLAVNASAKDEKATISVSGNEGLSDGENTVSISVKAEDGTEKTYTIKVNKVEGAAGMGDVQEALPEEKKETENEGISLTSNRKTISIMNPGSDVAIPEGFVEQPVEIDNHSVRGWVWGNNSGKAEYCLLYGMNEAGELNFYRFDIEDKTLQKFFRDPLEAEYKNKADKYPELLEKYNALSHSYKIQLVIACVLLLLSLALVVIIFVLLKKKKSEENHRDYKIPMDNSHIEKEEKIIKNIKEQVRSVKAEHPEYDDDDLELTRMLIKDDKTEIPKTVENIESTIDVDGKSKNNSDNNTEDIEIVEL